MSMQWTLNTKGDPLGTLHRFLGQLWQAADIHAMVLPPTGGSNPHVVTDPSQLGEVNPFQPVMLMNLARVIPDVLNNHPGGRLGVLLRPCELRALYTLAERGAVGTKNLLTICVDCLGTFPHEEFEWRSSRKGSGQGLTAEALQFAPQGGISAYRYRAACQMCIAPGAKDADVNICVLGLPVRQTILVEGKNGMVDWMRITDGKADPALVGKREVMLAKLSERHARTRERVINGLMEVLPSDLDALLDQVEGCDDCRSCMDACPICTVTYPCREKGRYRRADMVEWLASCAGCGMCEQACPQHKPLSFIITQVKQKLAETLEPSP